MGAGGAEHPPQPSPMGLILATQCVGQCRRVTQPTRHLVARRSCLPLVLQPSKTKEARSSTSYERASMSKLANKTSTLQSLLLCLVRWHLRTPLHPPEEPQQLLSHLLFRLAFGRGAGEDTAGAQQGAGGLPAADVCHQRGASAGNRGRDAVGPGLGTEAIQLPLSPKGDGGEGALPPVPAGQVPSACA